MSIELKSLFVSSTSDLAEERDAVWSVIREYQVERQVLPYLSDFDMRPGDTPEERLRQEIRNTDLFMMILGGRYGSLHPGAGGKAPPSICEWEFEEARKRRLTMLALEKELPPEVIEEPQRRFRERTRQFCTGTWRKTFSSREELSRVLVGVLIAWISSEKKSSRLPERLSWGLLGLAVALLPALWWLDDAVSRAYATGALSTATVVLVGFSGQNLLGMLRR